MFKKLKKLSVQKSAANIGASVIRLIDALLPCERMFKVMNDTRVALATEEEVAKALANALIDYRISSAIAALQADLCGPIPIDLVRRDLIMPFMSARVPPECRGVLIKKAIQDVLALATERRTKEIAGIESIWADIMAQTPGSSLVIGEAQNDWRFRDL